MSGRHLEPLTPSVNHQIDRIIETAHRIEAERDIFARALRDIANGRHLFSHRLRQIASDAIREASQL